MYALRTAARYAEGLARICVSSASVVCVSGSEPTKVSFLVL